MIKPKAITTILLMMLTVVVGCTLEEDFDNKHIVLIEGNEQLDFLSHDSGSRGSVEQLSVDSEISLFSKGAFDCAGDVLKYDGAEWTGQKKLFWQASSGTAQVCAYYPALTDASSLYDENHSLRDILYAGGSFESGAKINLKFSHLFPKITFHLNPSINATITKLQFRVAKKVTAMDMYTTALTLQDNMDEFISFDKCEDGLYSFQLPYSEQNLAIYIIAETTMGTRTVSLAKDFRKGVSYRCNINELSEKTPGIYTTQDFIDFITLYNGGNVEGKTLENFYNKAENYGGKRIFRLMNSLTFTPEESGKIKAIKEFKDVFDGMNHTLSGIKFSYIDSSSNFSLFIINEGEIKRVCIDRMSMSKTQKEAHYIGILCCYNRGRIHNCVVSNSVIGLANVNRGSSFLVYKNTQTGLVYNNGVEYCSTNSSAGCGLVYHNLGSVINNYVYRNSLKKGALLCHTNESKVAFCYGFTESIQDIWSTVQEKKGSELYCFYQTDYKVANTINLPNQICFSYIKDDFSGVKMNDIKGQALAFQGTLLEALNDCVVHKYVEVDSGIVLSKWVSAADGHPTFERHKE